VRIGFLIDSFAIGGTELNAVKVVESLTSRSVHVTVFHFQNVGPLRARYEKLGVELIHVPIDGLFTSSTLHAMRHVRNEAHERRLSLLHTHDVYSNLVGAGIRRLAMSSMPLLASRRWTGYSARRGLHTLNRVAQTAADAVLVNSPSLVAVVSRESPGSRPVYIPNLLPASSYRTVSASERREGRKALSLPEDRPLVGYVARLEAVKDHRTLLSAWKLLLTDVPQAVLAIVGHGSLRHDLEGFAQELGISESVVFTGEIAPESLPHSVMDVSVLSSVDEGFPNTLLEAMAQRVPIVSTDVGGVRDLVVHGENGLLVEKANPRALSDALRLLLTGSVQTSKMIAAATFTASQHSERRVTDKLTELYRSVISH
jgi:glycosyltransferase involved in cell wall biosynthesis